MHVCERERAFVYVRERERERGRESERENERERKGERERERERIVMEVLTNVPMFFVRNRTVRLLWFRDPIRVINTVKKS